MSLIDHSFFCMKNEPSVHYIKRTALVLTQIFGFGLMIYLLQSAFEVNNHNLIIKSIVYCAIFMLASYVYDIAKLTWNIEYSYLSKINKSTVLAQISFGFSIFIMLIPIDFIDKSHITPIAFFAISIAYLNMYVWIRDIQDKHDEKKMAEIETAVVAKILVAIKNYAPSENNDTETTTNNESLSERAEK